tara:strand:- start:1631 stop:2014 length:384 start_codon:yes stop_codon:yes gene_type:complete
MSDLSADGQTNYDEPSPTDAPQPLARPISQEGRLANTPFTPQRKGGGNVGEMSMEEEQPITFNTLQESIRDAFGNVLAETDPTLPAIDSETRRIDSAPQLNVPMGQLRFPTSGMSAGVPPPPAIEFR